MPANEPLNPFNEVTLDTSDPALSGRNAWMEALKELEEAPTTKPVVKAAAAPSKTVAKPAASPPPPATPVNTAEVAFADALASLDGASKSLAEFVKDHPYLIAPNVHLMWGDNLKEAHVMLTREQNRMKGNL